MQNASIRPVMRHRPAYTSLCTECQCVSTADARCKSCGSCGSASLVPYIDRRPMLLDRDVRDQVMGLVDAAVNCINEDVGDELLYLACEYLPFLQRTIESAEKAESLRSSGLGGYCETACTPGEIIFHLRHMRLPPTVR